MSVSYTHVYKRQVQGVDGLALETEPHVGVDAGCDADVGVAQQLLDDDEVDALFQEQGRGRMPQVVEADAAKSGPVEEAAEAAGEVGRVERPASRRGENESAVVPVRSCCLSLLVLPFPVLLEEWRHSVGRAMRRSEARVLVGRWVRPPVRVCWSERRMAAVPALRSRSSQWRPRSSPLRSPVRRASSYSAWSRSPRAASRNRRASAGVHEQTTRERWRRIHDLLGKGVGLLECARRLNLSLKTVKRYARTREPEALRRAPRYRPTLVDPYRDHLRERRAADPAVPVKQLFRDIPGAGLHRQLQPPLPLHHPGPGRRRPARHHPAMAGPPPAHPPRPPPGQGHKPPRRAHRSLPRDD